MRLTQEHIGVKVRRPDWLADEYFVPVRLVPGVPRDSYPYPGDVVGTIYTPRSVAQNDCWWKNTDTWELYQTPIQKSKPGLSLTEAMRSGKDFRPLGSTNWCFVNGLGLIVIQFAKTLQTEAAITIEWLESRYELRPDPKKVEVTKDRLAEILDAFYKQVSVYTPRDYHEFLIKQLGLDE